MCKVLSFVMLIRKAVIRIFEHQEKNLFKSCDSFPNGVLPTKRDVLQRLLHERNWEQKLQLSLLQMNYMNNERWIHCNVYCISVDGIVFRILTLVKDCRQIESQPKKGKKGFNTSATFHYNMTEFFRDIEELFNIFFVMTRNSDKNLKNLIS